MKHHVTQALREKVQLLERMADGIMESSRMLAAQKQQILNEMKSKNKNTIITIEGKKHGRTDRQTDRHRYKVQQTDERANKSVRYWADVWADGWIDRWKDGRIDRQTNRHVVW